MSKDSTGMGIIMILIVLLIPSYVALTAYPGAKATLFVIVWILSLVGGTVFGVRRMGMRFFHIVGKIIGDMFDGDGKSKAQTTPPKAKARRPPSNWTSKLIVATGDRCEFPHCRKTRHLEVHHIDEYAGGGSNRLTNLLVVCPEHHKDFGAGAMNKTRQREYARRPNRFGDTRFPQAWKAAVLDKESSRVAPSSTDGGWGF